MEELVEKFFLARKDPSLVVIEGFHALKHAIRFEAKILEVVTENPKALDHLVSVLAPDLKSEIRSFKKVTKGVFEQLSPKPPKTGLIAIAERPKNPLSSVLSDKRQKPVLLLENPKNLANVGACIRVAAARDIAGVLTTGTNDPWHPDAVRCSAGLHFALPVIHVKELPNSNRQLVAIDPSGEQLESKAIPNRAILAFGTERYGLSKSLLKKADKVVNIPMRKGVSSLNLATSVAVILYSM